MYVHLCTHYCAPLAGSTSWKHRQIGGKSPPSGYFVLFKHETINQHRLFMPLAVSHAFVLQHCWAVESPFCGICHLNGLSPTLPIFLSQYSLSFLVTPNLIFIAKRVKCSKPMLTP